MTSPLADDQAALIVAGEECPSSDVVRGWVHGALTGMALVPRLRAALVAEELVSNARRHGGLPCVLRLSLHRTQQVLLVCVDDCAEDDRDAWPVQAGLTLVDALSLDWGTDRAALGKTVWAEVALGV